MFDVFFVLIPCISNPLFKTINSPPLPSKVTKQQPQPPINSTSAILGVHTFRISSLQAQFQVRNNSNFLLFFIVLDYFLLLFSIIFYYFLLFFYYFYYFLLLFSGILNLGH